MVKYNLCEMRAPRVLAVINPAAGRGAGVGALPAIRAMTSDAGLAWTETIAEAPRQAWTHDRYFATIAGTGFDAAIVAQASRWPRWIGGKPRHVAAGLVALATTVRPRPGCGLTAKRAPSHCSCWRSPTPVGTAEVSTSRRTRALMMGSCR